ncbi:MAG: alpha/beta hydrolase [Candidatus Terrybacteria bacterium]|nr:alpha/beta hydrolase [Candidatus Terrybacteria bacterium]
MERILSLQLSGELGETRIAFLEQGRGDPIVFVHGLASSSRMWAEKVFPCLAGAGRLIALDLPGFGQSPALKQELTVARCADVVEAFLDALALDKPVLVGNSLGGTIVLTVGGRRPTFLRGIVAQGAVISGADFTGSDRCLTHLGRQWAARMPIAKGMIKQMVVPSLLARVVSWSEAFRWDPRGAAIAVSDYMRCNLNAMLAITEDLLRVDLTDVLKNFSVPVIMVDGNEVTYRPLDTLERIGALLPSGIGVTRVIQGAGHLAPFVKPHQFADLVRVFAQKVHPQ